MIIKRIFKKEFLTHLAFWAMMYVFHLSTTWDKELNKWFLAEQYLTRLVLQILLAYTVLFILIPYLLNKGHKLLFIALGLMVVYLAYYLDTVAFFYYFIPQYPDVFQYPPPSSFFQKSTNFLHYLKMIPWFTLPSIILVARQYYRDQKEVSNLRDQKKSAELAVLKNQLNPHFLFNTMNNLYALALKKSDQAPEVIAKLSEMLDYMLYRCNDKYVSLSSEVTLLNNYIALEQVRYGKRLEIAFTQKITQDVVIAPLLLLTFLENAFKHGVSQEVNKAVIKMVIESNSDEIIFEISNTISSHKEVSNQLDRDSIGLKNVQKQLDLLYPKRHRLTIDQSENDYAVKLKLNVQ